MVTPALSCASTVEAPRWGTTTTDGSSNKRRLGRRLLLEDVERGTLDVTAADRLGEVGLVDDAAARHVDDPNAGLGLGFRVSAFRRFVVSLFFGRWIVMKSLCAQQRVQVHQFDAHVPGPLLGDERVVGDEAHAEGQGPLGDERADLAEPDDAQGLAVQLHALPLAALPLAVLQRGVGLGDVARLARSSAMRLLGGREDVRHGGVDDHDAELGGLGDVDVVEADAGAPHDHEVLGRLEGRGVHLGGRADDERVGALRWPRCSSCGREPETDVDLVSRVAQFLESGVGDLFGNKYSGHGATFRSVPQA